MDTEERRANGAGELGLLTQIFPFEMSMARTSCATCGKVEAAGAETVFADAPGTVLRCVHCESVLIRVVHGGGRYWLDMQGTACLQLVEP